MAQAFDAVVAGAGLVPAFDAVVVGAGLVPAFDDVVVGAGAFDAVVVGAGAFDAVVVGAGVNGSSAALYLAKAGKKTALLEQFSLPHSRGSSGGQSRIIRFANYGHKSVSALMKDSFSQWKKLEQETGTSLFRPFPFFTMGRASNHEQVSFLKESLLKSGEEPVWRLAKDMNEEYRTTFDPDTVMVEDSKAGIILAEKGVATIQKRFQSLGGTIIDCFPVSCVSPQAGGTVRVESCDGKEVVAGHVALCAGPWASKLLEPLGLQLPLKSVRTGVFYWPMRNTEMKTFSFVNLDERFDDVYGLPQVEYPGLVKICLHGGKESDPDFRDLESNTEEELQVKRYIEANFPWIRPEVAIRETCMYTLTPDNEAIIDFHPKHPNIIYACGFSGTGFKTGLTVGQVLSEMVLGRNLSFDMSAFKADRFQTTHGKSKL